MTTVLISGASGFIAAHTIQQLLAKGYSVAGTVRSEEKGQTLSRQLKSPKFSYEIVKDLEAEGAFDQFVKNHPEATVFLHTASPFHFNITDVAKELLEPAVSGTVNVLKAIKKFGPQIERVVVTSSYAAMADITQPLTSETVDNEDTWSPLTWETSLKDAVFGYFGSKALAERAAWDFVKTEKPNFVLSVVNPVYTFGPQPFFEQAKAGTLNTSSEIISGLLKLKPEDDGWLHSNADAVDVRDVAAAHLVAFEKEEAKNKRLLLQSGPFSEQTIVDVLHEEFPELTKNVPVGKPGSDVEQFKKKATIDNSRTRAILGFKLRTVQESVRDSAQQIFEARNLI